MSLRTRTPHAKPFRIRKKEVRSWCDHRKDTIANIILLLVQSQGGKEICAKGWKKPAGRGEGTNKREEAFAQMHECPKFRAKLRGGG